MRERLGNAVKRTVSLPRLQFITDPLRWQGVGAGRAGLKTCGDVFLLASPCLPANLAP